MDGCAGRRFDTWSMKPTLCSLGDGSARSAPAANDLRYVCDFGRLPRRSTGRPAVALKYISPVFLAARSTARPWVDTDRDWAQLIVRLRVGSGRTMDDVRAAQGLGSVAHHDLAEAIAIAE